MCVCHTDYGTVYIRECPAYYPSERRADILGNGMQTVLQGGGEHDRTALL